MVYAYVKNKISKNGDKYQILVIVNNSNNEKTTKEYYLNYSNEKNSVYLSEKVGK